MHATRVQYTVRPEFAAQNKSNIGAVMAALQAEPIEGLSYAAFCKDDGVTFVHLVIAVDDETQAKIPALPEFQAFQAALLGSQPVSPPAQERLDVVGMSRGL